MSGACGRRIRLRRARRLLREEGGLRPAKKGPPAWPRRPPTAGKRRRPGEEGRPAKAVNLDLWSSSRTTTPWTAAELKGHPGRDRASPSRPRSTKRSPRSSTDSCVTPATVPVTTKRTAGAKTYEREQEFALATTPERCCARTNMRWSDRRRYLRCLVSRGKPVGKLRPKPSSCDAVHAMQDEAGTTLTPSDPIDSRPASATAVGRSGSVCRARARARHAGRRSGEQDRALDTLSRASPSPSSPVDPTPPDPQQWCRLPATA